MPSLNTQQSYQELLQKNITDLLKMNHTSIEVSEQNKGLIAQGHDFIGNPTLIGICRYWSEWVKSIDSFGPHTIPIGPAYPLPRGLM